MLVWILWEISAVVLHSENATHSSIYQFESVLVFMLPLNPFLQEIQTVSPGLVFGKLDAGWYP